MKIKLRLAALNDVEEISQLIQLSARKLGSQFYDDNTIESALQGAFGVDTQLIKDKTYYVIENLNTIIACGGWSYRKTLFGSDTNNIRNAEKLDPTTEAAKIRAFFIHPNFNRLGLGKQLLQVCEQDAITNGFKETQLMSTLSGISFYQKNGYKGDKYIMHDMGNSQTIEFLPMHKDLIG